MGFFFRMSTQVKAEGPVLDITGFFFRIRTQVTAFK
jgi:hypothetical protein